ncbi:hypothetical protein [Rubrivivax gelatinosus]|uniref:hypothetical protein n=1 Tax=Rubrivivax gelatinosus TaxID=28068 RepID=UPI001902FC23|nr:hypothetical protein [Rubrivivax gelatinosus]
MPEVHWSTVATGVASFVAGVVIKTILDLRLGVAMVKYFWWVRPRWIFGENPHSLSGTWDHIWDSGGSDDFISEADRHAHPIIRQLGPYCYAEYISKRKIYYFFGRVVGQYFIGEWFDLKDRTGYYGTFELHIINSNQMIGKWMGHSQKSHEIRVDISRWIKVSA